MAGLADDPLGFQHVRTARAAEKPKLTGGRVNYYLAKVDHPQREDQLAYQAECEDIIHALGMTFDEGCLFKALWRSAAARQANGKPGHSAIYDAEKMNHYAGRILRHLKNQEGKNDGNIAHHNV